MIGFDFKSTQFYLPVIPVPKEFNESFVAQKLQLLAYLVSHKVILGVLLFQDVLKSVHLRQREFAPGDSLGAQQGVQKPSAGFYVGCPERLRFRITVDDKFVIHLNAVFYDKDFPGGGDA